MGGSMELHGVSSGIILYSFAVMPVSFFTTIPR